jgi:hypothetical protein
MAVQQGKPQKAAIEILLIHCFVFFEIPLKFKFTEIIKNFDNSSHAC